jgi:excisionase family DNA binding protein
MAPHNVHLKLKTDDPMSLLTVKDVADFLRVPVTWVYARTRVRGRNRIPGFRLGKYWRFSPNDVNSWLERQRSPDVRALDLTSQFRAMTYDADSSGRVTDRKVATRPRYQDGSLIVRGKRRTKYLIRWREDIVKPDGTAARIQRAQTLGPVSLINRGQAFEVLRSRVNSVSPHRALMGAFMNFPSSLARNGSLTHRSR